MLYRARFMKQPTERATTAPARPGIVMAVVCTGVVLSSLDLFIVNVALPQIAQGFDGASLADLSWVLNAYAVVFAAFLVPAGRLADRTGRRDGFLIGIAIFTAASAACAAATGVGMLVAFRSCRRSALHCSCRRRSVSCSRPTRRSGGRAPSGSGPR